MATSHLTTLIKRDNGLCHYCNRKTNRVERSPRQATKDHVVPRAFGGKDNVSNYVLACAECNNRRGTTLFYCSCDLCEALIRKALNDMTFINKVFDGMVKHNRPRVYAYDGKWATRRGHHRRIFDTWDKAVEYSLNGSWERGN